MTAIIIVLAWFSALGIILPVNAYLAAGRDRADRAAERMLSAADAGTGR